MCAFCVFVCVVMCVCIPICVYVTCEVTNVHATYQTYDCVYVCRFLLCLCCGVSDNDMLILLLLDCSQL